MSIKIGVESPFSYKIIKKTVELHKDKFKICETHEKEKGHLKKTLIYIHFDGRIWSILNIDHENKATLVKL